MNFRGDLDVILLVKCTYYYSWGTVYPSLLVELTGVLDKERKLNSVPKKERNNFQDQERND
jgi:hypothetical protein